VAAIGFVVTLITWQLHRGMHSGNFWPAAISTLFVVSYAFAFSPRVSDAVK
jgi:hypothetical protein